MLLAIRYDTETGVSVYHVEQYFENQTVKEALRGIELVSSSNEQEMEWDSNPTKLPHPPSRRRFPVDMHQAYVTKSDSGNKVAC